MFKVPERYRVRTGRMGSDESYGNCGAFRVPVELGTYAMLNCIASNEGGWEHVSVSLPHRTPTWEEMEAIRVLFWGQESLVMQLHVPRSRWVNTHNYVLHLWRPIEEPIPMPPREFV